MHLGALAEVRDRRWVKLLKSNPVSGWMLALWCLATRSQLAHMGWFRTHRTLRPTDGAGQPLPWLTYPMIALLEERVTPDLRVFEYGCGNSTLWWARRVREVVAVEHDPEWHERVRREAPPHVKLLLRAAGPEGSFARAIREEGLFDIVVIDGAERCACAREVVPHLTPRGVVVWDNSDWVHEFEAGFAFLQAQGFKKLDFVGMGAVNYVAWASAVFYRPGNCLDL